MSLEPKVTDLRGELPKAIQIPPYDGGISVLLGAAIELVIAIQRRKNVCKHNSNF
jgi:hypothetical protein